MVWGWMVILGVIVSATSLTGGTPPPDEDESDDDEPTVDDKVVPLGASRVPTSTLYERHRSKSGNLRILFSKEMTQTLGDDDDNETTEG